jgi:hypothetical protein
MFPARTKKELDTNEFNAKLTKSPRRRSVGTDFTACSHADMTNGSSEVGLPLDDVPE